MFIEDGTGNGYKMGVNAQKRALAQSITNLQAFDISLREGRAFNFVSYDPAAAAADHIFYLKNTDSERDLRIDVMRVCSANAALFKVWGVTGTPSGTELTGANLNRKSNVTASADAYGDAAVSGLTTDDRLAMARVPASGCFDVPFDDILILGTNDALAVEYDTGTGGAAEVLCRAYFIKPE